VPLPGRSESPTIPPPGHSRSQSPVAATAARACPRQRPVPRLSIAPQLATGRTAELRRSAGHVPAAPGVRTTGPPDVNTTDTRVPYSEPNASVDAPGIDAPRRGHRDRRVARRHCRCIAPRRSGGSSPPGSISPRLAQQREMRLSSFRVQHRHATSAVGDSVGLPAADDLGRRLGYPSFPSKDRESRNRPRDTDASREGTTVDWRLADAGARIRGGTSDSGGDTCSRTSASSSCATVSSTLRSPWLSAPRSAPS
jgi:hypothetical protein